MRVVFLNSCHDVDLRTPQALLDRYRTLTDWAREVAAAGAEVVVVQGFTRTAAVERDGVRYLFVAGLHAPLPSRWRIPTAMHRTVFDLQPDVVHVNGLLFPIHAIALRRRLAEGCALVAQHHGESPPMGAARFLRRLGLRSFDGFFFTCRELAEPWLDGRLICGEQSVWEVLEGSSRLQPVERARARETTGMHGDPVVLWVGRLHPVKDPLTVLAGFEAALDRLPGARLFMVYQETGLLAEVRQRLAASPRLGASVQLLGTVAYERMDEVFSSADCFVLGSRREGSGYALIDALACGVVPVVTDIPSFRHIMDCARIGALWAPGDASALADALVAVAENDLPRQGRAARALFEERLGMSTIARDAVAAYQDAIRRRRRDST